MFGSGIGVAVGENPPWVKRGVLQLYSTVLHDGNVLGDRVWSLEKTTAHFPSS